MDVEVTPDGSPVAVYLALPAEPQFTPVLEHLAGRRPPPLRVLDLGCGVGRLTDRLVALGDEVTAVDESAAMLAHVDPRAERLAVRIEELALPRRFDVVVLASHLVNDPAGRAGFLAAARRHLADGGAVLVETYDPDGDRLEVGTRRGGIETPEGPLTVTTTVHAREGARVEAEVVMELGGRAWTQPFVAEVLDRPTLSAAVAEAGLRLARSLTPTWHVLTC